MKIAFFDTKPYDRTWFEVMAKEYSHDITFLKARLSSDNVWLAKGHDAVCIFVNDNVDKDVINQLVNYGVKGIFLRCAGFNNVDLGAAADKIKVYRVPSYSPEAVAEFSMAMLLCVNRGLHRAYNRTRDFNMSINGLMGTDLNNKVAGIVGTGKIGQAMINICKGFNMRVIAYDVCPNPNLDAEYVSLEKLFEESDIISLHCPLTEDTKYMINRDSLNRMKEGVYLVNTSRGELINTSDLIEKLRIKGRIGGVALDVYEEEEDIFYEDKSNDIIEDDNFVRLMSFPNVLITSHQGYFTVEAMQAICKVTMENVSIMEKGITDSNTEVKI